MLHIEHVEAIQFNSVMTAGRTTPLLLTCERADGKTMETVVKFASGAHCTQSSLCAELIASQLAADLGLPTPTPVLVRWEQAFADSLLEPLARQVVTSSAPPAFGSTFVTGGFATWSSDRKLIGESLRQTALATFFFDAMIGNSDRGGIKPNILVRGDSLRLIDHEMAFRDYMLVVKPTPPWALGGLNAMVIPGAHIFANRLVNGVKELDFGPIRAKWAALSDRQIEAYVTALPSEWNAGHQLTAFAIGRIKECRNRIDDCVTECRRVLNETS
jgi:hypothetical protein